MSDTKICLFVLNLLVLQQRLQVVSVSNVKKSKFKYLITGGYDLEEHFNSPAQESAYNLLETEENKPEDYTLAKQSLSIVSLRSLHYVKYFGDNHFCGGSLISSNKILTAAHCVYNNKTKKVKNPNEIVIFFGSTHRLKSENSKKASVNKVIIHPEYNTTTLVNDIAVLQLSMHIVEDGITVQSVPIPNEEPKEFMYCTAAGWGRILDNGPFAADVTYVDLMIIPKDLCNAIYIAFKGRLLCLGEYNIFDDDALEKGPCKGDSGGPLFCNGALYGVISFGLCNGSGYPYGFTNVWYYRDWINYNSENKFQLNISLLITTFTLLQYVTY